MSGAFTRRPPEHVACLSFPRVACTNSETAVRIFINFTTESLTKFSDWTTEKSWFNFRQGKMFSLFERSETFSGFLPASCLRGRVRSFGEPERPGNKLTNHVNLALLSRMRRAMCLPCHVECHPSVICQTTGPQPLPERFLHLMRSTASSFK